MARRKLLAVLGVVVGMLIAPAAGRADVIVAPPFDEALNSHYCEGYVVSACAAESSIVPEGAFAFSVSMTSPNDGALPGPASGGGSAYFYKTRQILKDVPAIEITIGIHIDRASVERAGAAPVDLGGGFVELSASANAYECFCYDYEYVSLADDDSDPITDEDLTVTLVLRNEQGGNVKAGRADLTIDLYGSGSLGGNLFAPLPNTGTLAMDLAGTITSVTARVLAA